jgi:hypothetical protein
MSIWEGKKLTSTATTNSKIEQKTMNTSYTKSYKKISTKSAQNEQNYFVKERKVLQQANCVKKKKKKKSFLDD